MISHSLSGTVRTRSALASFGRPSKQRRPVALRFPLLPGSKDPVSRLFALLALGLRANPNVRRVCLPLERAGPCLFHRPEPASETGLRRTEFQLRSGVPVRAGMRSVTPRVRCDRLHLG